MSMDPLGIQKTLKSQQGNYSFWSLAALEATRHVNISRLPFTIRVLLESVLRNMNGHTITEDDVSALATWKPIDPSPANIPFLPARVLMQDFTGVPAVVDLAAMRDALIDLKLDPALINPVIPVDLVIDHSVQVDQYGSVRSLEHNAKMEFMRNRERYEFLRWGAGVFNGFRVVPPATGIVHQVNLEYLADIVHVRTVEGVPTACCG